MLKLRNRLDPDLLNSDSLPLQPLVSGFPEAIHEPASKPRLRTPRVSFSYHLLEFEELQVHVTSISMGLCNTTFCNKYAVPDSDFYLSIDRARCASTRVLELQSFDSGTRALEHGKGQVPKEMCMVPWILCNPSICPWHWCEGCSDSRIGHPFETYRPPKCLHFGELIHPDGLKRISIRMWVSMSHVSKNLMSMFSEKPVWPCPIQANQP
jgi:hypothetical protein